jgi:hypothetical protein
VIDTNPFEDTVNGRMVHVERLRATSDALLNDDALPNFDMQRQGDVTATNPG